MTGEQRTGIVMQVSVSDGGVPKLPVAVGVVTEEGLYGDRQADRKNHGGVNRAVCLYSYEVIQALRAEGHPIEAGSAGENLTISGIDWSAIGPGSQIAIGVRVILEVTNYTVPCYKNAQWFTAGNFDRMSQKTHPGESRIYARVIAGGEVRRGDLVALLAEPAGSIAPPPPVATYRWPRDFA